MTKKFKRLIKLFLIKATPVNTVDAIVTDFSIQERINMKGFNSWNLDLIIPVSYAYRYNIHLKSPQTGDVVYSSEDLYYQVSKGDKVFLQYQKRYYNKRFLGFRITNVIFMAFLKD